MTPIFGRPRSESILQTDFPDDDNHGEHRSQFSCGCELVMREVDNYEGWSYGVDLCSVHRRGAKP